MCLVHVCGKQDFSEITRIVTDRWFKQTQLRITVRFSWLTQTCTKHVFACVCFSFIRLKCNLFGSTLLSHLTVHNKSLQFKYTDVDMCVLIKWIISLKLTILSWFMLFQPCTEKTRKTEIVFTCKTHFKNLIDFYCIQTQNQIFFIISSFVSQKKCKQVWNAGE